MSSSKIRPFDMFEELGPIGRQEIYGYVELTMPKWPRAIDVALYYAQQRGFMGVPETWEEFGDRYHRFYIVACTFPNSPPPPANARESLYVVVSDEHNGGGRPTLVPLSTVVHVIQNMTEDERWMIESRPPR